MGTGNLCLAGRKRSKEIQGPQDRILSIIEAHLRAQTWSLTASWEARVGSCTQCMSILTVVKGGGRGFFVFAPCKCGRHAVPTATMISATRSAIGQRFWELPAAQIFCFQNNQKAET